MEKPTKVTLLCEEFPIKPLLYFTQREDNPFVLIDNLPIASLKMTSLVFDDDSVKLAEIALRSYRANNGAYSVNPGSEFSFFDIKSLNDVSSDDYYESLLIDFDLSLIDVPGTSIDVYSFFNTPHLAVSSGGKCFNIWNRELIKAVITRFNTLRNKQGKSDRIFAPFNC